MSRANQMSNRRATVSAQRGKKQGGEVVSKLVRILGVILIAFSLSSLLVYRLRLGSTLRPSRQSQSTPMLAEETKVVEGHIQTVDPGARTFTLLKDGEEVMLAFDERTSILESGRPVQPASITSGTPATVKYTQRGGRKWARKIELVPAEPPDASDSY